MTKPAGYATACAPRAKQSRSAEANLEQAKQDDALAASERLRAGATVGAEQPAVESAQAFEGAKRNERAAELAAGAAAVDLASAIRTHADGWLVNLDAEQTQARTVRSTRSRRSNMSSPPCATRSPRPVGFEARSRTVDSTGPFASRYSARPRRTSNAEALLPSRSSHSLENSSRRRRRRSIVEPASSDAA